MIALRAGAARGIGRAVVLALVEAGHGVVGVDRLPQDPDAFERVIEADLADADVAFMGDDIVDLAVLGRAGLSAAPVDAVAEVRSSVDWISSAPGGNGAARELVETILRAQQRWDAVLTRYLHEGAVP